jgi:hypothetical protein
MNRTLKEATVQRYYDDTHGQLRRHLADFLAAYNFAKRLKMLKGLTPHEYVCQIWTTEPLRFRINPTHNTAGLYSIVGFIGPVPVAGIARRHNIESRPSSLGAIRRCGALGGALAHDAFASAASSAARSRMFGAGCLFFAALPCFIGRADHFVNLRLTVSSGATGTASTSSFGSRLRTALMAARRPPMIRTPRGNGRADSRH